jgi:hypothetical protein
MDSLTPASRLYGSPTWAFYVGLVGPSGKHLGLLSRGILGRDEVGRFARCLGPAAQFAGVSELYYLALGDTLYSTDSAAYTQVVHRLAHGGDSMVDLVVRLAQGDFQATLPGLVVLGPGAFDPTVSSATGRGNTSARAVLRQWAWRDGGSTFAEDTAHASLIACVLS